jgi:hypothetical protein
MANTKMAELADGVVEAMRGWIKKAVDPTKEIVGGLIQRADRHFQQIESLERRASRHAEHLARLENRLQSLEKRGKG